MMIKTESESCSMLISARKSIFCSINLHIITGVIKSDITMLLKDAGRLYHIITGVIRSDITVQSYKANQNNF